MKLTKQVQYGVLFCLYLTRAGRASVDGVSKSLGLSVTFLQQVTRKLCTVGLIKSVRGPGGGYELVGNPTVGDVFDALSPIQLVTAKDSDTFARGEAEGRAFLGWVNNLSVVMNPLFKRTLRGVGNDLILEEMSRLDSANTTTAN